MRFPEEIVAASFVPTWRSLLVRALDKRGLSQNEIALHVGITQSAVSKHLMGKLGADPRLENESRLLETVEHVAEGLVAKRLSSFEVLSIARALVHEFEDRGPICRLHEEEMPSLQGVGCDLCVRGSASELVPQQAALADLRAALRILERAPAVAALVPHVGSNLARATAGAVSVEDVAAVPGALYVARGAIHAPAPPEFGVSRHVAKILVAVHRQDPTKLACLNLSPDPAFLDRLRAQGLRVERVPATIESTPDGLTFPGEVPDAFYHEGAFGIEPQAYLVGLDASQVARAAREAATR